VSIPSNNTVRDKVAPLPIKDVTAKCITKLKAVPMARAAEGFKVPPTLPSDKLIPQADESIFLKLYVTEGILKEGKFDITSTDLFPNYIGRIFEVTHQDKTQLVLVGFSNELSIDNSSSPSLPFLIYIPPNPQDNANDHRKIYPHLYSKTPDNDVPIFYKDDADYPYSWDWLYFQCFSNMYRLSYQLKKSKKPYVFAVPLVRSFSDGIGLLDNAVLLERCLVAIQKTYLDEKLGPDYILEDIQRITLASFSIGDSILSNFIQRNRETSLFRDKTEQLIILDPPFGNPKNRSPIITTIISVMRANKNKSVFLYTQDAYYIQPLIDAFLKPKGIAFDLSKDKLYFDPKDKRVCFAYLEPKLFKEGIQDPQLKGVHNTFPNLFINNAIAKNSLEFRMVDGKAEPIFSFLQWAPTSSQ
jgi:hypothetical protein